MRTAPMAAQAQQDPPSLLPPPPRAAAVEVLPVAVAAPAVDAAADAGPVPAPAAASALLVPPAEACRAANLLAAAAALVSCLSPAAVVACAAVAAPACSEHGLKEHHRSDTRVPLARAVTAQAARLHVSRCSRTLFAPVERHDDPRRLACRAALLAQLAAEPRRDLACLYHREACVLH